MKKSAKKYVGSSPMKFVDPVTASLVISAGVGLYNAVSGGISKRKARRKQREAEAAAAPYLESYKSHEYKNPYENMENVYENMRVNTEAAEFQREQLAQQQANIIQGLRGSAGGSGIAALGQAMARAGAVQAQKISAGISEQETAREKAILAEESRIQGLEMYGDQLVDQQEMQRNMNLYSIEAGQAGLAAQQFAAGQQQMMGGIGQVASAGLQAYGAGMFDAGPSAPVDTSTLTYDNVYGQPDIYTIPDSNYSYVPVTETPTAGNQINIQTPSNPYGIY